MFTAVLRDAWRQYRRRPQAAALALVVGGLPVFLQPDDPLVAVPLALVLLAAGLLLELFLVAWLAGVLDPVPASAATALAAMRANIAPGVRAGLLRVVYLLLALMVGLLLFGSGDGEPLPRSEQTKLAVGLWPLFGLAFALLAALSLLLALVDPYLIGMGNALYLRTRADQAPAGADDGSLRPPRR